MVGRPMLSRCRFRHLPRVSNRAHVTNKITMDDADNVSTEKQSKRSENSSNSRSTASPEQNAYRFFFDFESSAEAAYVSPAVSPEEMFEILKAEARALIDEPFLHDQLHRHVLSHTSITACLASVLSFKLANDDMRESTLFDLFNNIFQTHPKLITDMVSGEFPPCPSCFNYSKSGAGTRLDLDQKG
jgi:hypothetical protein